MKQPTSDQEWREMQATAVIENVEESLHYQFGKGWNHFSPEMRNDILVGRCAMSLGNIQDDTIDNIVFTQVRHQIRQICFPD